jgi:hypothetical protein
MDQLEGVGNSFYPVIAPGAIAHLRTYHPNSGLPEFGNIIVQVGNSRLGWRGPGTTGGPLARSRPGP